MNDQKVQFQSNVQLKTNLMIDSNDNQYNSKQPENNSPLQRMTTSYKQLKHERQKSENFNNVNFINHSIKQFAFQKPTLGKKKIITPQWMDYFLQIEDSKIQQQILKKKIQKQVQLENNPPVLTLQEKLSKKISQKAKILIEKDMLLKPPEQRKQVVRYLTQPKTINTHLQQQTPQYIQDTFRTTRSVKSIKSMDFQPLLSQSQFNQQSSQQQQQNYQYSSNQLSSLQTPQLNGSQVTQSEQLQKSSSQQNLIRKKIRLQLNNQIPLLDEGFTSELIDKQNLIKIRAIKKQGEKQKNIVDQFQQNQILDIDLQALQNQQSLSLEDRLLSNRLLKKMNNFLKEVTPQTLLNKKQKQIDFQIQKNNLNFAQLKNKVKQIQLSKLPRYNKSANIKKHIRNITDRDREMQIFLKTNSSQGSLLDYQKQPQVFQQNLESQRTSCMTIESTLKQNNVFELINEIDQKQEKLITNKKFFSLKNMIKNAIKKKKLLKTDQFLMDK